MKQPKLLTATVAAITLSSSALNAAIVSVFFDGGSNAPGSTNTAVPFTHNTGYDNSWIVPTTEQSGLSAFGATAVLEVRMITLNVNGDGRNAANGGNNGLAVFTGSNDLWWDGGTGEGALFQLKLYTDATKATEITGLSITLNSLTVRKVDDLAATETFVDAFAGDGTVTKNAGTRYSLEGTELRSSNDGANWDVSDLGLKPTSTSGIGYYTFNSTGVSFNENESLLLRRRNTGAGDIAYQLGAFTVNIVPEPSSVLLVFGSVGLFCLRRRK